mgnify:FL=1|jgi:Rrf2 family nitric oxide-sensitive transcriptional repressor
MQLTRHSDYSLRVLIYLALNPGRISNVSEIAQAFNVSRNHLVKVVHNLSKLGYISTTRGHGGGIALTGDAADISVGEVVRDTENTLEVINCIKPRCPIYSACRLKGALDEATAAFLDVLDNYTIDDIARNKVVLKRLIA